ncbi:MAG: phage major capsid protein, partial [Clostridiales bacterium]|nr:phage major capsid protein [Clostridiales bacterium]
MKNKDALNATQLEIAQRISNAAKEGNQADFEAGLQEMFQNIHDQIVNEAEAMKDVSDATILAQRGVRQLTSEERGFYNNLIDKMKAAGSTNPMNALTNTDKTFPLTIITQVMEDMKQEHPLLAAVDTVSVSGLTKILLNADGGDNAAWGALESAITKEIDSAFKEIDMTQNKLSAWMPISIDMLELGANWLDSYIRTCLSEALAIGFENAIVTGTGKDMPIGMDRQVQDDVTIVGGVYPQKDAIAVTDLKPASYGALVAQLAVNEQGKSRAVRDLILV